MLAEVKALETQLKEILYGCVEHVQATKAALYLSASHDLSHRRYEIVTSYRYHTLDRQVLESNDDLVDTLAVKRGPFFVNGLKEDRRFAEILFREGAERLLAAPLFARGRLVGFLDLRDKAAKKPFETSDLEAAGRISEALLQLLTSKQLYGLAPITLSEAPRERAATLPGVPIAPEPRITLREGEVFSTEAAHAVHSARSYMSKRQHVATAAVRRILSAGDLEVIRLLLPAALAVPNVTMAALTAIGNVTHPQTLVAAGAVTDDVATMFRHHLDAFLSSTNQRRATSTMRPETLYPFGPPAAPMNAAAISTILSAPVSPKNVEGLVLTLVFEGLPKEQAAPSLQNFLRYIESSVDTALRASSGRSDRQLVAEKLLEPDFQSFPAVAEHSREVAKLSQRFAQILELPAMQVEIIRLAALVHDVGMRLLDYERLYSKANLTGDEMRGLTEHPIVGAALVEPILGPAVAQAVLRHHERVDGTGYPSRLTGPQIPLASRVIQICDAWVAMTSEESYRPTASNEEASSRMREGSGTQFDAELLTRFLSSLPEITV